LNFAGTGTLLIEILEKFTIAREFQEFPDLVQKN